MIKDINGKGIHLGDVVRDRNGRICIVVAGKGINGDTLGVVNDFQNYQDRLDIYPDGELEVLGNMRDGADD